MRRASLAAAAMLLLLSISGCAFKRYYWTRDEAAPQGREVQELVITRDGSPANFPQHFRRDTLLVDLQSVRGQGRITLWLKEGSSWPVRLAFQVTPGSIGELEIDADQRSVLPIARDGTGPIELELDPGVYSPVKSGKITVAWRPAETVAAESL